MLCWRDLRVRMYWTCRLGQSPTVARSVAMDEAVSVAKRTLKSVVPMGQPRTRMPSKWIFSSGMMEGRKWGAARRAAME